MMELSYKRHLSENYYYRYTGHYFIPMPCSDLLPYIILVIGMREWNLRLSVISIMIVDTVPQYACSGAFLCRFLFLKK